MKRRVGKHFKLIGKIFMAGILVLFCISLFFHSQNKIETYQYCEEYVQMRELPFLLDFYFYDSKEWAEKIEKEAFGEVLTREALDWILEQTGTAEYITFETENNVITRLEWNTVYEELLDLLDETGQIQVVDDVVLKRKEDELTTTSGTYQFAIDGIEIEPMTAMGFYIKGDKIIGICEIKSKSFTIPNVFISKVKGERIEFILDNEFYEISLPMEEPNQILHHVCDLNWQNGMVTRVQIKEDTIKGNLIAVKESTIEIEGYGELKRSLKLPVYKTYGTLEEKDLSDIVIANMKVEYVVAGDSVEAILLTEPPQISRIRILLLADDNGIYRDEVCILANGTYRITANGQSVEQSLNTVLRAEDLFADGIKSGIQIVPCEEATEFFLCDASGNPISKGYQGSFELHKYEEGYTVVNELPIEQYLTAVVPSEMPDDYEAEALKAQAVCARSYAYIQLERGDYAAFGAHVDDSTNYQVYNKQDRDEKTTNAVLDTAGKVISYAGKTAEAYYFSTSAGTTGNGEAWNLTADPKYAYLKSTLVKEEGEDIDLSTEEAFRQFIMGANDTYYESSRPYFRWKAVGDYESEETQKRMQSVISTRKERTPENILFYNLKKEPTENMKKFGNLERISVSKRSTDGIILQLLLEYKKGMVVVENEYNIRAILGAGIVDLTLADGSQKETTLLPSAYTTVIPVENGTYSMYGGGYGHGIGMSQNGAQAMAEQGKSCEEILQFFYQNIEITNGKEQR